MQWVATDNGRNFVYSGHDQAPRNNPVFSIVRNPFSWLISMWHHNWGKRSNNSNFGVRSTWPNLENFLYEFNSHELSCEEKWNSVKDILWKGTMRHIPHFSHRHLQMCQTFDPLDVPGEKFSYAEFYVRLETLSQGLDYVKIKKPSHINRSKHKDYRSYYDTKLIDHITAHRQQELDLLGYDFEGPTDDLPAFKINKPFMWNPPVL